MWNSGEIYCNNPLLVRNAGNSSGVDRQNCFKIKMIKFLQLFKKITLLAILLPRTRSTHLETCSVVDNSLEEQPLAK